MMRSPRALRRCAQMAWPGIAALTLACSATPAPRPTPVTGASKSQAPKASAPGSAAPASVLKSAVPPPHMPAPFSAEPITRELTLLHSSDHESRLLDDAGEGSHGGLARFVGLIEVLRTRARGAVLTLAAGDTLLPSPLLSLKLDGTPAVIAGNNLVGFQASALGNHEFDLGENFLAGVAKKARFPYLSATLDVKGGALSRVYREDGGFILDGVGGIHARAKLCLKGELVKDAGGKTTCKGTTVGLVGATTDRLSVLSHLGPNVRNAASMKDVAQRIQTQVDALSAEGVDIIVLLSHMQDVNKELQLLELGLRDVDIIVGGGGDNRLANADHQLIGDDTPDPLCAQQPDGQSCYPLVRKDSQGQPVLVVATDGQYHYVGQLAVAFDAAGKLTGYDTQRSRPWPTHDDQLAMLGGEEDPASYELLADARMALQPLMAAVGESPHFLNGVRESVRNRETNLGNLSADAMLFAARKHLPKGAKTPLFALRNGGGIRASIGTVDAKTMVRKGGPVTELDVRTAFSFNDPVVLMTTTHAQLKETLESALRGAGTSRGQFPQVSAELRITYDINAAELALKKQGDEVVGVAREGQRIQQLVVERAGRKPLVIVEKGKLRRPRAKIAFVTLKYLSKGGDGYFPSGRRKLAPQKLTLADGQSPLTEQAAFKAYLGHLSSDEAWNKGERYADPRPDAADSFQRIITLGSAQGAAGY